MYYIAPSFFADARQARIVFKPGFAGNVREDYRTNPQDWLEVGLMDSHGALRCLEAPEHIIQEFQACAPLAAGLQIDELDIPAPVFQPGPRP